MVCSFLFLFFFSRLSFTASYVNESLFAPKILDSTPILSSFVDASYASFEEIYGLKEKYENTTDKNEYNKEALDILLIESGKLEIPGVQSVLEKYRT